MKPPSSFVTLSTLLQIAESLATPATQDVQPRVLGFSIQRSQIRDPLANDRRRAQKRAGTVKATIDNLQTLYFLNATLGTPPQNVRLHLDTGSSDLWVNTPSSRLCSLKSQPCSYGETYSANASSTYSYISSAFNISYVDGSGAAGDYATDTLRFSGKELTSLQFGIGYDSSSAQNIVGLGYPVNEALVARKGVKPYQNLPAKLAADGVIATSGYSLWLNDLYADSGNVLFGGIDTAKFEGSLVSVPIQEVSGAYSQFFVTMTGLDIGSKKVASDAALAVLLDSGSSLTYLPNDMTSAIYQTVGATYSDAEGVAFIPCTARSQTANSSMTFRFSDPASVTVTMSEMILDLDDLTGKKLTYDNNVEACLFGIVPTGTSNSVLGDTFLRSAYVVYDLDSNEIGLANTKYNVTTSNVVEIQSGSIPSATKASNPVAATNGLPFGSGGGNTGGASEKGSGVDTVVPPLAVVLLGAAAGVALLL
ncbi:candidapepsin-4 precursor [Moelleriella libera RCEF 2490]|uniref:Probable aspartic-type endopeptidase OPSB n=1 Tax=Moelleriella libera RCEF 2490 TaxID=1081109 RepID=A0A168BGV1_9HYPO|nr:candidapepsin-4 precursor [Moelleriella libera RCEF 2490]